MHMRGTPRTMQRRSALRRRRARGRRRAPGRVDARGRRRRRRRAIARRSRHRVRQDASSTTSRCSRALPELAARVGVPLLVGTSRKSFLGRIARRRRPRPARDDATLATTVWCFEHGAAVVRVHDVAGVAPRGRAARRDGPRDTRRDGGVTTGGLRGRWAQGLQPRYFTWVIKDRLGAGERPGGFARNHRKVRRQEELIWLNVNGFTHVVSLLDSPHNLHAYDEAGLAYVHVPLGPHDELAPRLDVDLRARSRSCSTTRPRSSTCTTRSSATACSACSRGYLLYAGLVEHGPHAVSVIEKLTVRSLGADGREIVAVTLDEHSASRAADGRRYAASRQARTMRTVSVRRRACPATRRRPRRGRRCARCPQSRAAFAA